jgi:hypothetical protein
MKVITSSVDVEQDYKMFLFEYYHDEAWWCFTIPAQSEQDAIARVRKLPFANFLGVVDMQTPTGNHRTGLLARVMCWWRNRR